MLLFTLLTLAACQNAEVPKRSPLVSASEASREKEPKRTKQGRIEKIKIKGKEHTYEVLNGMVIVGGDMVLGNEEDAEQIFSGDEYRGELSAQGFALYEKRWPSIRIPFQIYDIPLGSPLHDNILAAIEDWENKTPMRFYVSTSGARLFFRKNTFEDPTASQS